MILEALLDLWPKYSKERFPGGIFRNRYGMYSVKLKMNFIMLLLL